jgi:hypothetical protein
VSTRTVTVDIAVESRAFVGGDAADLLDLAAAALDRVRAEGLTTIDDLHLYPGADGRVVLVLGSAAAAEAHVLAWARAPRGGDRAPRVLALRAGEGGRVSAAPRGDDGGRRGEG